MTKADVSGPTFAHNLGLLEKFGYRYGRRDNLILELSTRVLPYVGDWTVYDPEDKENGFIIVGDNVEELVQEAVDHLDLEYENEQIEKRGD